MTIWLTRIVLSARSRVVRNDLADAGQLHKRVMSLLPNGLGEQARAVGGMLYRYDDTSSTGPHLLVQSGLAADPARLPPGYGQTAVRDLTPLLDALEPGIAVHYRITANTSKRLGRTEDQPGKIVALRGPQAEQWWHSRAQANGLMLRTLVSTSLPDIRSRGKGAVRHAVTRFDGVAVIKDADLVHHAVVAGIGRGKAYGCGLLSLAPIAS